MTTLRCECVSFLTVLKMKWLWIWLLLYFDPKDEWLRLENEGAKHEHNLKILENKLKAHEDDIQAMKSDLVQREEELQVTRTAQITFLN